MIYLMESFIQVITGTDIKQFVDRDQRVNNTENTEKER